MRLILNVRWAYSGILALYRCICLNLDNTIRKHLKRTVVEVKKGGWFLKLCYTYKRSTLVFLPGIRQLKANVHFFNRLKCYAD
jgi:hypothetical protein